MNNSDLIQMIQKRVGTSERTQGRLAREDQWLTLRLFWENRSDCDIVNGRVYSTWGQSLDPDEVRYKCNLIRARGDTAVAKVLAVDADLQARPPTEKKRDRDAALVTNKIFGHVQQVVDWPMMRLLGTTGAMIYGSQVYEIDWDPNIGEPDRYYLIERGVKARVPPVMLSEEQRQAKEDAGLFEDMPPGDITLNLVSPFAFHWDSSSRDKGIAGAQWCATRLFADTERVAEAFNCAERDVPVVEADSGLNNYEEALAFMDGPYGSVLFDQGRPEDKRGKRTLLITMWQRPSKLHPKGLRVVMAGNGSNAKIMNPGSTNNPWAVDRSRHAHLPFVLQHWKPRPGNFWGVGAVEDALQPQYYMNKMRSAKIDFALVHGQPATYVDSKSGLDSNAMTTKVGRIYRLNGNAPPPTIGPIPQQPREVMDVSMQTQSDLDAVMSQSEVSGAKLPGQIRSGTGIRALNQERFQGLTIPAQMFVRATAQVGNVALSIGKLKYREPRIMRYLGSDDAWAVRSFTHMDIVNDIIVTGEPDISDSIAGQKEEVQDWVQSGLFNPQMPQSTQAMIFEAIKFKGAQRILAAMTSSRDHQDREIQEILADPMKYGDKPYPIMPYENHELEMEVCVAFLLSADAEALKSDQIGRAALAQITAHWELHSQALAQQRAQQLAMMEAAKGQPGQASQPKQAERVA